MTPLDRSVLMKLSGTTVPNLQYPFVKADHCGPVDSHSGGIYCTGIQILLHPGVPVPQPVWRVSAGSQSSVPLRIPSPHEIGGVRATPQVIA